MTVREVTVEPLLERADLRSVGDLLRERVATSPGHVAFGRRRGGVREDVTTAQFAGEVRELARGLVAAGVQPGDAVAVMSATRYEWAAADFAIWAAGAVVVPVYETASTTQAQAALSACGVKVALVGGAEQRAVLAGAAPDVRVWSFDADPAGDLAALAALGDRAGVEDAELERRGALAGREDLASVVFTSGTTGAQKGVRITHGNFVALVVQVAAAYREVVNDRASTVLFLPLAHVLAQGLQLVSVHAGMKVVHEGDPRAAVAAMAEVRPTFMVVVPRVLEKIRAAARKKAADRRLGRAFALAERTAIAWGEHLERNQEHAVPPRRGLALRHRLLDRLFYRRLRALMGGRVEYLLSGASALDADLGNFFRGAGVPVLEGYGLTETTAPVTGNRPGRMRAGSVGRPIPGSTVRISDEGEVLVRGVGVTPGYLRAEDDEDAFVDGFYRTGDLGSLDDDGFLTIRGRLKNILVTAGGKNIAPEPWERIVATDPLVAEAVVVGEGRPYVAALLVLDADEADAWARRHGRGELAERVTGAAASAPPEGVLITDQQLVARLERTVAGANAAFSRAEQVRRFAVLASGLTQQHEILTPTQKLRRERFLGAVAPHVEHLYQDKDAS